MPPQQRQPFQGPCRKLVLALDVGTTYSGISYSILDPGEVPQIKGVTRYETFEFLKPSKRFPDFQAREVLVVTLRYLLSFIIVKKETSAP
jgi:hypothetical protein